MGRFRFAAILLAGLALIGVPSATAGAVTSDTETHCVVEVVARAADGELLTGPIRCHTTFAEAMAVASYGRLRLAAATSSSVVFTDEGVAEAVSSFTVWGSL